jgi:hypothetical protein
MTAAVEQCRPLAHADGPAVAMAALLSAVCPDVLPCGPGGHAFVPATAASSCRHAWLGGAVVERAGHDVLTTVDVEGETFVGVRCTPGPAAQVDPPAHDAWLGGLAWLRLGLAERHLAAAMAHLARRTANERPLLHLGMVRGMVADAVTEAQEACAVLESDAADMLAYVHDRITVADRTALHLLGASGFVADGPGQEAYVSELLADTYVTRAEVA